MDGVGGGRRRLGVGGVGGEGVGGGGRCLGGDAAGVGLAVAATTVGDRPGTTTASSARRRRNDRVPVPLRRRRRGHGTRRARLPARDVPDRRHARACPVPGRCPGPRAGWVPARPGAAQHPRQEASTPSVRTRRAPIPAEPGRRAAPAAARPRPRASTRRRSRRRGPPRREPRHRSTRRQPGSPATGRRPPDRRGAPPSTA